MTTPGGYLYCIIRCDAQRAFEGITPIGSQAGPVYTVVHGGLAAVVSDTQTKEYGSSRAHLLAHQRVLERVMEEFTLLPVRFGTVANGASPADRVRRLLEWRAQEFQRLLAEMEGKVELGLKALWRDERAVFEEIVAQDEGIKRFRDALSGKPPQATYFERVRLGQMVKEALERKRRGEVAALLAPLQRIAVRTVENPVTVDRMVANAAFLVDKRREEEFDEAVRRLDQELGKRLAFRYVGPAPPYNFVNVTVNWSELEKGQ